MPYIRRVSRTSNLLTLLTLLILSKMHPRQRGKKKLNDLLEQAQAVMPPINPNVGEDEAIILPLVVTSRGFLGCVLCSWEMGCLRIEYSVL